VAGPVVLAKLGPERLTPLFAMVTSPQGARDVLGATQAAIDKTGLFYREARLWLGDNVFNMAGDPWLPRRRTLQSLFTRKHVATFAVHMARAAEELASAWVGSAGVSTWTRNAAR
jgi:cytochrome P450